MVIEQTRFRGSVTSLLVVPGGSQSSNLIDPRIYAGISAKLSSDAVVSFPTDKD